jgi:hypothetical protein
MGYNDDRGLVNASPTLRCHDKVITYLERLCAFKVTELRSGVKTQARR